MKIGLSYSRCIRDIIDGKVDVDDVLVIIARTKFNPHNDTHWSDIWNGYKWGNGWSTAPEWDDYDESDEDKFRQLTIDLYDSGKIHQPRQYGGSARRSPYIWLEASLLSEDIESNAAVKAAWEQFQIVAGLVGSVKPVTDDF